MSADRKAAMEWAKLRINPNAYDDDDNLAAAYLEVTADLQRRLTEVEAYLVTIRDTGMNADEAAEHAADALRALSAQPNAAAEQETGREQSHAVSVSTDSADTVPAPSAAPDVALVGLELAAKICEDYRDKSWDAYLTGYFPDRDNEHTQGASNGARDCAKAIRDEIAKRTK